MDTTIRLLKSSDALAFKNLRIASLQWDPDSWLSSMAEEKDLPLASFANKILYAYSDPIYGYYGLFENDKLSAYAQLSPSSWNKKKHIATLYDVCVDKSARRRSVGSKLIKFIIDSAKRIGTLEKLQLFVTSNNTGAAKFYESLGFVKTAIFPESVKEEDGRYQDEYLYVFNLKKSNSIS
jgi:ribosomal protein S18 acetylase RimI-like enzyme